jgi:PAS domain S-box-containing protein
MDRTPASGERVLIQDETPARDDAPQNSLFRLLVESVSDYAIFLLDPTGHIMSWNAGARRIKGYEAEEITGKHFSIFYTPQEVKRGKPGYGLTVAAADGSWQEEGWRVRQDGSRFWASVVITALRGDEGELIGFAKVTRDLTEHKQTEDEHAQLLALERAARKETEATVERLQAIQSVTEAALVHLNLEDLLRTLLDRIGEILSVDTVAVLLVEGPDRDELVARAAKGIEEEVEQGVRIPIGRGFAGRVAAEQRPIVLDDVDHAEVLNPLLLEKGIHSLLGVPLLVEGRVVGVLHVGSLYHRRFTEQDTQFLQIVGDRVALAIEHARLTEEARVARQEAEISEATLRAQDEFLSIAAHELRTPVTSLRMGAQLLVRRLTEGPSFDAEQFQRGLTTIDRQSSKLTHLITQLLDTARIRGDQLQLHRTRVDLADLVAGEVELVQARSTRHTFVLVSPPTLSATIDPLRFEQVMTNLLDNAVKYSPDGGRIEVELSADSSGIVRVTVRDEGVGVSPDHRSHLFERFYRAHADDHRSGMGLGLHISKEIVIRHGGRIWAEFPPGGGTCMVVEIPQDESEHPVA